MTSKQKQCCSLPPASLMGESFSHHGRAALLTWAHLCFQATHLSHRTLSHHAADAGTSPAVVIQREIG